MPKKIDLTNKRFGKLVAIEPTRINNRTAWLCKCDCGNEKIVQTSSLTLGNTKSCGCYRPTKRNLIGQKFGKLIVISETTERDPGGCVIWECQCDCGNKIKVKTSHLTTGNTKSCGCTRIEKLIENNRNRALDLTNKKFGKLTALYKNGTDNNKNIVWHCICDCGKETDVSSHDLVTNNTKSCGCMRNSSYGESKIKELLDKNNIAYIKEYSPNTLSFKGRFDFYLPLHNIIIEYDGIQHFKQGNGNYDNEYKFKLTQEHDKIKTQWCIDNNIKLIRIPYTKYETLTIDDLIY